MDATKSNLYVYVSIAGENRISIFKMSPETAALTSHGEVTVYSPPSILAVHPTRMFFTLQFEPRETSSVSESTGARVSLNC